MNALSLWPVTTRRETRRSERNAFEIGRDSTASWPLDPSQRKR
jgi:hypothetical protein